MEPSKVLPTNQWSRFESRQDPRPTKSAFQWEAVAEHIDEMCDSKDKGEVVPCPTECQDTKTNVGVNVQIHSHVARYLGKIVLIPFG